MEGFSVPIHKALVARILILGVPRDIAILNGTLGAAIVFGLHSFWGMPLWLLCHLVAVKLTKKDDMGFEVLKRSLRFSKFYEA